MNDGRQVIDLAIDCLREISPALGSAFAAYGTGLYARTSDRRVHWSIAHQPREVISAYDTTDTPAPRVAAELILDIPDSRIVLASLDNRRTAVEEGLGKKLSWLPGGTTEPNRPSGRLFGRGEY